MPMSLAEKWSDGIISQHVATPGGNRPVIGAALAFERGGI
ncbi:hypothetical protein HMPREF0591_1407 [Mycobacterium parascrofulaceum ATCC BAA-614]|uniref:Uncharacterized protein n=1 Tax=Mycobacterium parascrofulaceum ATCC BAA-614 TaxID=525368 RepID=D5P5G3_9MYCO|nr:hypothetical protein HMPREF0591_1407 [Mycobacterium parascrofulaceum ATCC BAA-614]